MTIREYPFHASVVAYDGLLTFSDVLWLQMQYASFCLHVHMAFSLYACLLL